MILSQIETIFESLLHLLVDGMLSALLAVLLHLKLLLELLLVAATEDEAGHRWCSGAWCFGSLLSTGEELRDEPLRLVRPGEPHERLGFELDRVGER